MDLCFPHAVVLCDSRIFIYPPQSTIKFVIKKGRRLIIPLVVLTVIAFFPKALLSDLALRPQEGGVLNLLYAIIVPSRNPMMTMWFLNVLFGVYLIAIPVNWMVKSNIFGWAIVASISALLSFNLPQIELFGITKIFYFFPYFCLGQICRRLGILERDYGYNSCLVTLVALMVFTVMVYLNVEEYILACWGIISAITLIISFERAHIPFFPSLRKYTYSIYLLQWFPLVAVRMICYDKLHWNDYVCYVIMFVMGLFVPIIIAKGVSKVVSRNNRWGRFILYSIGM
ncbi:MAG: acyltransferase [Muribaculaceae bacterium]|nr:acyltransferase [Muribaculaceae bacterium]